MYIDPTRYSGRPADCASRLPKEQRCYDLLGRLGIAYFRVDHDHADTIEACEAVEQVLGEKICKNLFLCNRQKTQFYLLMLEGEKVFKTRDLSKQLGVARLSFADPADMEKYLDITPGSVSVLGLMNDLDALAMSEKVHHLEETWAQIGCTMPSPFMTMALIPLACLPELRLTNRGLVDCTTFQFVDLVVGED